MAIFIPQWEKYRDKRPSGPAEIDENHWAASSLVSYIDFGARVDLRSGREIAVTNGTFDEDGISPYLESFGSSSTASIPINLSAYNQISVSFDLYWPGYANDDDFAFEFTSSTNGNRGFFLDPNSGAPASGKCQIALGEPSDPSAFSFIRPSIGWHRYSVNLDRAPGSGNCEVWIDGAPVAVAKPVAGEIEGNFADSNLYLFSRNNSALFGEGRLRDLSILGRLIDVDEALDLCENPYQILKPRRKFWAMPSGAAGTTSTTSGTTTESITEADIVAGGKTTILTLTNDTWVADDGTFAAVRQAIIDKQTSAQTETFGWNNEVRDKASVTDVARTDDNTVKITWGAAASYDITAQETITPGIPAAALVTSTIDVVSSPTFTVDFVAAAAWANDEYYRTLLSGNTL